MSILQEYARIRKQMGEEKFAKLEKYLEINTHLFLSDIYYKESEYDKFESWLSEENK